MRWIFFYLNYSYCVVTDIVFFFYPHFRWCQCFVLSLNDNNNNDDDDDDDDDDDKNNNHNQTKTQK